MIFHIMIMFLYDYAEGWINEYEWMNKWPNERINQQPLKN